MAEQRGPTGGPAVTDRRPVPRGVLPRNLQTWVMAGLAAGIVAVIVVVGEPEPPAGTVMSSATPQALNADRVQAYQDRLRALEAEALRKMQATQAPEANVAPVPYGQSQTARREDPLAVERRRRNYESLFASNVALSRRQEGNRPDAGRSTGDDSFRPRDAEEVLVREMAEAVIRATTGSAVPFDWSDPVGAPTSQPGGVTRYGPASTSRGSDVPRNTEPISPSGPLHRILEGTVIDTVLTNRLDGSSASPVNLLVTNPVYSHSGQHILIPGGARVLGETTPVQTAGEERLAVALHRLVMPDGSTVSLDQFLGLNQIGDTGLRDQVNHHYWSTFGAAGAVGLISGFAQWVGTAGFAGGSGDRTVVIAGGAADETAQASLRVMNRFLNRLPTITIREGHRVKVYITSDMELPEFARSRFSGRRF